MIKLTRVRDPKKVHENFYGKKRVKANLKLLRQKRDGELEQKGEKKWDSKFWKAAKDQLLAETYGKCAYCESPTRVVSYGDVEHFRPKSIYWWLAYSYENYLASCGSCNQEYKKDYFRLRDDAHKWSGEQVGDTMTDDDLAKLAPMLTVDPIADADGMSLSMFSGLLAGEQALLVNPYYEEPSEYFAYKPVLETRELVVVPTRSDHEDIVKACEDLFGINRKELLDLRFQHYCKYITFRYVKETAGLPPGLDLMSRKRLIEMAADWSEYAGMVRYFDTIALADLPWNPDVLVA